jgi:hypothetical protein
MAGEEVTGLHAFDDLDPISTVSALNAMPDPDEISGRTEVPLTRTTPPEGRLKMPPPSRPVSGLPPLPLPRVSGDESAAPAGGLPFRARPSAPPPPPQGRAGRSSLPPPPPRAGSAAITISISPQSAQPEPGVTLGEQDEIGYEGDEDTKVVPNAFTHDPEYAQTAAFARPEGDPAAFETSAEPTDDQLTSVKDAAEVQSPRAGNGIGDNGLLELSATTVATNIDMDWDEEEVETKLRDEGGMPEVSPSGALVLPLVGGRPSPFPSVAPAPIGHGGQPSPFGVRSFPPATGDERNDGSWEDADEAMTRVMPSTWSPSMPPSAGAEITGTRQLAERFPWLAAATTLVGGDRRAAGNRLAWLGFAAVALIAFAVAARALVAGRQLATVTLATKPVDALVLVDDSPLTGQTSPFTIQGLKPGIEHTVEVRKDGFATESHRFRVAAGEVKPLPTIELAGQRVDTGFALASLPAGAAVYIDGHKLEQPTPVRIADLAQGLHVVRLEYGTAYQPWETQVALAPGQVIELPTARLVPASPSSGASFVGAGTVSRNAERHASSSEGSSERHASSSEGSSGHHHTEHTEVREPKTERTLVMQPAMRAPAPPMRAPAPAMRAPISAPSAFAAPSGSQASLRLNSRPWSQVFIDGRMIGNTPQLNLPLPAGHHKVKLVNPQLGMSKAFSVDLKAGKVVTKVVDLQ